jgi:large subunit ribosomal protein L21
MGKQYKVVEGQELTVDRMEDVKDAKISLGEVLLFSDGKKVLVGSPTVKGVTVKATVQDLVKGDKIRVSTFKAKSRYRNPRPRQAGQFLRLSIVAA